MVTTQRLKRQITLSQAVALGLGSIIGTGIFVSIGLAAGIAGIGLLPALAIAAIVATCNGLNSAQLAASHPVNGGTYEYGYRYLNPQLGFTAGWLFLLAKSASAATAALGFAGYLLHGLGLGRGNPVTLVIVALAAVVGITGVVLSGIQRSSRLNTFILTISVLALLWFVVIGTGAISTGAFSTSAFSTSAIGQGLPSGFSMFYDRGGRTIQEIPIQAILQASALMFVAYSGYARITTLGEEVQHPERTIPRAILMTLGLSFALYFAVGVVGLGTVGAEALQQGAITEAAPLALAARRFPVWGSEMVLGIGAIAAMLGVLLNLLLGLSRVLLAMARRGDMPITLAQLNADRTTPTLAVLAMGGIVALLVLLGNVKTTWSFSAFSVLGYYAITNLAALRLPASVRQYPRWTAGFGLAACVFLAFWVEWQIWFVGLGLIGLGLIWQATLQHRSKAN
ncbi:APC family permease [Alkalinema sp. FACHB-956]|uniref:APC family permease n=1 Tax=Alkalinema sp. FACHB-956 TaxID=2692768 RepID=UPI0018EFE15A|nr:APC family permease [Alkalinema sp. FACHB-956]